MRSTVSLLQWSGTSLDQGECWHLRTGSHLAVCRLFTHEFSWELRLDAKGELLRSQVCRSEQEFFDTHEAWKVPMGDKGWV